jgi:hypothetical protein
LKLSFLRSPVSSRQPTFKRVSLFHGRVSRPSLRTQNGHHARLKVRKASANRRVCESCSESPASPTPWPISGVRMRQSRLVRHGASSWQNCRPWSAGARSLKRSKRSSRAALIIFAHLWAAKYKSAAAIRSPRHYRPRLRREAKPDALAAARSAPGFKRWLRSRGGSR